MGDGRGGGEVQGWEGEVQRGRQRPRVFCSAPGLESVRPHSVGRSPRPSGVPWGRLCPQLGQEA